MEHKPNKGRYQDRKKIASGQPHEVNYEKEKMNVSGNCCLDHYCFDSCSYRNGAWTFYLSTRG